MTITQSNASTAGPTNRRPLRLWPGVLIVVLALVARFVVPIVAPDGLADMVGPLSGLVSGVGVLVWWAFFSRAPRLERFGGAALLIVALVATRPVLHESVATGMMGMLFPMYAVPILSVAFVAWAVVCRNLADGPRRATMIATILLACGAWALVRANGISGYAGWDFGWRWQETPEERLLAQITDESSEPGTAQTAATVVETPAEIAVAETEVASAPVDSTAVGDAEALGTTSGTDAVVAPVGGETADVPAAPAAPPNVVVAAAEWPGFRGPARDGVVHAAHIATDWSASPPVELWRRPIGPGWSSFAVQGDRLYTQEQRGGDEIVACYSAKSGEPVWTHRDDVRFWESNAGAGPRATPALHAGRVYSFGGTGILNALDAGDGSVVWSRNAASDTGQATPMFGFSGSPLVVDDMVVVAVSGQLAAYDLATGASRWVGPTGGESYSSPHLLTLDGVAQVLLSNMSGMTSVSPADGAVLWQHAWPGFTSLQPAQVADTELLISASGTVAGKGIRRLAVARGPGGFVADERWTSVGLKPYFNDFVVHEGHAFGFDGRILSSIDLEDGARKWKGGRYGNGQLVLLPEQDLLLVLSEQGELALVSATPGSFQELARFEALDGKTWNHPVLIGDLLLVRNDQEMAAYRLPLAGSSTEATAAAGL